MFDQNIYRGAFDAVHAPDGTQKEILDMTVNNNKNPIRFGRKFTAIAIAACLVLSLAVVAYAIGKAAFVESHSWKGNEYTSYTDIAKAASKVSFPIKVMKQFSDEYCFSKIKIVEKAVYSDEKNLLEKYNVIEATYQKPDHADLTVWLEPVVETQAETDYSDYLTISTIGQTEVKYDVTHYKVVPVDYKETAQDRELIENGHYQISYGSDKIEEYDYSSISFTIDNVNYVLMTTSTLPEDEMFTLAEEYIDFINN